MDCQVKNGVGRPTEYNPKYCDRVDDYLSARVDKEVQVVKQKNESKGYEMYGNRFKVQLPTLEGFALFLGVSLRVLSDWEKRYPEFLRALDKIRTEQKQRLIDNGLSGDYNSTIAKLILSSNHGMSEKTETEVKGKIQVEQVEIEIKR